MNSARFDKIYKIIQRIPKGKVATYGQIAALAGYPGGARTVGWALNSFAAPKNLPWHRVISASGKSSLPELAQRKLQQALLEQEGVVFNENGRLDLDKFRWHGQ